MRILKVKIYDAGLFKYDGYYTLFLRKSPRRRYRTQVRAYYKNHELWWKNMLKNQCHNANTHLK